MHEDRVAGPTKLPGVMVDSLPHLRGELEIVVSEETSPGVFKEVDRKVLKNLVVNNLRTQIAMLIANRAVLTDRAITRLQIGTNGTAPAVTDAAITGPVEAALTYDYPNTAAVRFTGTITTAQGNGTTFQEAGLVFTGAGLACRVAFDAMIKSATFQWTFQWTLTWN